MLPLCPMWHSSSSNNIPYNYLYMCVQVKLSWMNGQHLKALAPEQQSALLGGALVSSGLVKEASSNFVTKALALVKDKVVSGSSQLSPRISSQYVQAVGRECTYSDGNCKQCVCSADAYAN